MEDDINMKNRSKKAIATIATILSIGLLPLTGLTIPDPYPPEPPEVENGEEPGGGQGCEPLSDIPEDENQRV